MLAAANNWEGVGASASHKNTSPVRGLWLPPTAAGVTRPDWLPPRGLRADALTPKANGEPAAEDFRLRAAGGDWPQQTSVAGVGVEARSTSRPGGAISLNQAATSVFSPHLAVHSGNHILASSLMMSLV